MSFLIGLDIGGTKIAGAVFDSARREIAQIVHPTPPDYSVLVMICQTIVEQLDQKCGGRAPVGVGVPGAIDQTTGIIPFTGNTPCLDGKPLRQDLENVLKRSVRLANDADCAALSEAVDGAGAGQRSVFGLIIGTGVGGGFVIDGKIVAGANGLTGEFGHLLLPFREDADGPFADCPCGQKGCIDKSISGGALARLYRAMTGRNADAEAVAALAGRNDADALRVLDRFYTTVAKAMIAVIYTFDPEIIVVSGGLNGLPRLYDEVPKRWSRYMFGGARLKTKFAAARHGPMSGLRGAAWVGRAS